MKTAARQRLTALVHAHAGLHNDDLPYWEGLAHRYGNPILELGCGSGRVLLHLAQHGFEMVGVDNNPAALAFLEAHLPGDLQPKPEVHLADMRRLDLSRRFPLIILPCNTYSMFTAGERLAVLERVRQHLAPGGCLALSLPNPFVLLDLPVRSGFQEEESFSDPTSGSPVQVLSAWRKYGDRLVVRWRYELLQPDGQVLQEGFKARHYLVELAAYRAEFALAGFQMQSPSGDFDGAPFTDESPYLILELSPRLN